ncbi:hypothetical protein BDV59DRAFT_202865 [Aspergillus ambiguus]|uniref:uncharacterized protein n=1 Tax=Aspergillus ambiguus TaxID=176160 RepID=UPI003CCE00FD
MIYITHGYNEPGFECATCSRVFRTNRACVQHMNDTNHNRPYECQTCSRKFYSQSAADQHMDDTDHWAPEYECETCSRQFHSQSAADQHMQALGHYRNYCKDCDRRFQSENNLWMHLNSKVHRGRSIVCPFCTGTYTTVSGLTHHLERGACPNAPNVNREAIHRFVSSRDPGGTITNKQIAWRDEDSAVYNATDCCFNGDSWECYICHREFCTKNSLNSHLNSPTHKQSVYRCPNTKSVCRKQFSTLAALFNHLENEACAFMRFENVQRRVGNFFQERGLITF